LAWTKARLRARR